MISRKKMREKFEENPLIIAVTDDDTYRQALKSNKEIIFLLDGNISNLKPRVTELLEKGKIPFVHIDMIAGMSSSPVVVEYIAEMFNRECGIITTKPNLVKKAIHENVRVVHRVFMVDSKSRRIFMDNITNTIDPDAVEIMPAFMPKIISDVKRKVPHMTIIAGGLVTEKKEAYEILNSGATAISSSSKDLIRD